MNNRTTAHTCIRVQPRIKYHGKQELDLTAGISAESVGAQKLCMHVLEMAPNEQGCAHLHRDHETAIYIISGRGSTWYGENLEHHATVSAGEMFYIPANVPHLPYNPSSTEKCVCIIARTDPSEQESVTPLPELDAAHWQAGLF